MPASIPAPVWLTIEEAHRHCTTGISIWDWASSDGGGDPDVVLACCGDVPTLETLAAADLIGRMLPSVKVRVINVIDLMKLQPPRDHPHGIPDADFEALFTRDKPVVFAFHGYATLIHKLTYRRSNHDNLHVRGFKEEGTTTTPFDMCVLNGIDRFHLVDAVVDVLPQIGGRAAYVKQALRTKLLDHHDYIRKYGDDMPEVRDWGVAGGRSRRKTAQQCEGYFCRQCLRGLPNHSATILCSVAICFHSVSSSLTTAAKVAAFIASGSVPSGSRTGASSGEAAIAVISWFRRSMIAAGVPAGANTPTQMSTAKPGATDASGGRSAKRRGAPSM